MEKYAALKDLSDKEKCALVVGEIQKFQKLVKGHEKLLEAVGRL